MLCGTQKDFEEKKEEKALNQNTTWVVFFHQF